MLCVLRQVHLHLRGVGLFPDLVFLILFGFPEVIGFYQDAWALFEGLIVGGSGCLGFIHTVDLRCCAVDPLQVDCVTS